MQNKHIIRLSFVCLFISIIASIIFYRYFMIEAIILNQLSVQNNKIAEIYIDRVWNKNSQAIKQIRQNKMNNLLQDKDVIEFLQDTSNLLKNLDLQIAIFDNNGNEIMNTGQFRVEVESNDFREGVFDKILNKMDRYFLADFILRKPFESAFQGKTHHIINTKTITTNIADNKSSNSVIISSYIPIIDNNFTDGIVDGMIKIDANVSQQWENIGILQKRILITFIVIFSVFFGIIMYNTNYAQNIINKQFETNRELEEAKAKAETENSAKTEFLANVSHELRTPLNAIIGFSEIMISDQTNKIQDSQYKDYVQDINNSGKHLLSVINDILDFSKAAADKLKVEKVELDLNKLASSSMRFVKPRADEAKVNLVEKFPSGHVIISADPKRLKQALLNLLSNSVKFTPENGSVTLGLEVDELKKLVAIKVVDTGIGMSEKDIPKAMASFGQVDNKLSRKYEGTGLGLPLTKKLVELMNGKFEITSTIGIGTTVTITFKYDEIIQI
jgi:two-component system cell cycle sensor histidine kinase PleC